MRIIPTFQTKTPRTSLGRWTGLVILVAVLLITPILWWRNNKQATVVPTQISKEQQVIQEVGRVFDINPKQTTLEQIDDVRLYQQLNPSVYTQAQTGDWMITTQDKLIIYRATTKKVINVIPKNTK